MRWRRERAQELLRQGLLVQQVAERLAFANPFHFARAYRRHHGHPPSRDQT
jgi:AraC-like DNA-binding protein